MMINFNRAMIINMNQITNNAVGDNLASERNVGGQEVWVMRHCHRFLIWMCRCKRKVRLVRGGGELGRKLLLR